MATKIDVTQFKQDTEDAILGIETFLGYPDGVLPEVSQQWDSKIDELSNDVKKLAPISNPTFIGTAKVKDTENDSVSYELAKKQYVDDKVSGMFKSSVNIGAATCDTVTASSSAYRVVPKSYVDNLVTEFSELVVYEQSDVSWASTEWVDYSKSAITFIRFGQLLIVQGSIRMIGDVEAHLINLIDEGISGSYSSIATEVQSALVNTLGASDNRTNGVVSVNINGDLVFTTTGSTNVQDDWRFTLIVPLTY